MIVINQFIFKPFRPEGTPFEDGKQLTSVPSIILVNIASVNTALLWGIIDVIEVETS